MSLNHLGIKVRWSENVLRTSKGLTYWRICVLCLHKYRRQLYRTHIIIRCRNRIFRVFSITWVIANIIFINKFIIGLPIIPAKRIFTEKYEVKNILYTHLFKGRFNKNFGKYSINGVHSNKQVIVPYFVEVSILQNMYLSSCLM